MRGVDVDAYCDAFGIGVHGGAGRAETFGEYDGGATVQQPVGLGVALDGHGSDHALR